MGWTCASCGELHEGLPAIAFRAPDAWLAASDGEREADFDLSPDICIWRNEHFFMRCSLELPIIGTPDHVNFGIWCSLSEANFDLYLDHWDKPDRMALGPFFSWLGNQPPDYPDATHVKCNLHPSEPEIRPWLELERNDHLLSRHYHEGVTREWASAYVHKHLGI